MSTERFDQFSLMDLFRQEAEGQMATLDQGLLSLERGMEDAAVLESLMRAAHSLKGAARIVGIQSVVEIAHALEDCFVAMQGGGLHLQTGAMNALFDAVDLIRQIAATPEEIAKIWDDDRAGEVVEIVRRVQGIIKCDLGPEFQPLKPREAEAKPERREKPAQEEKESVVRIGSSNLSRLLGMAGELMVEARGLEGHAKGLFRAKRQQERLMRMLERMQEHFATEDAVLLGRVAEIRDAAAGALQRVARLQEEFEQFMRRSGSLSQRFYDEVLSCRMRPFGDGLKGFPRLVRDLAQELGKEVRLELEGVEVPVDREILEKLESPLTHLIRNALDHALEPPHEREQMGKPREGVVRLEARHTAGMLTVSVLDDGRGVDLTAFRFSIVRKHLTTEEMAARLTPEELLEFLFLPGFSMKEKVNQYSGRGVGLDVVQDMVRSVGGNVRITSQPGKGTRFQLQLPLTLSVKRALTVEIAGEAYAFSLARIYRTLRLSSEEIERVEGREYFKLEGQSIGLVSAAQIFRKAAAPPAGEVSVVVLGERNRRFGVAVDRFLGEEELIVQPLDARLGKIKDIHAGAIMPDGSVVLLIDSEDLIRSIELMTGSGDFNRVQAGFSARQKARKRILVVDDSLTVRELERKLLTDAGYEVEVSVDGMDGWNAVRGQAFDLVLTDVDMPRMDGFELVKLIKGDARLSHLPVIIISYKDRAEDRHRGMEAGADYYLTKGSFHDESLLKAVVDLIGPSGEESRKGARG